MESPKQYLVLSGGGICHEPAVFDLQKNDSSATRYSAPMIKIEFNHADKKFSIDTDPALTGGYPMDPVTGEYVIAPNGGLGLKVDTICDMCSPGAKPLAGSFHDTHEQAKAACREREA